jgi:3-deoxy-D-manno-octulosonic-acid transferase
MGYNLVLLLFTIFFLPWLFPVLQLIPKRRKTFWPRMGWCTYSWEKQPSRNAGSVIWIHALSVGEVNAAQSLIRRIIALKEKFTIYLSVSTLSGYQTAARLFSDKPVYLTYFPYDWLWSVRRVAKKIQPDLVILVETDIWPNFLREMNRCLVPVCLANVRLSDRTWTWCRRLAGTAETLFSCFAFIGVQSERDYNRFLRMGIKANRLCVTGNIKFDVPHPSDNYNSVSILEAALKRAPQVQVIVAGSTHEGEEEVLIDILQQAKKQYPQLLMIIAPRDPGRAGRVLKSAVTRGVRGQPLSMVLPTENVLPPDLLVVDCFGVLSVLYRLADICFIGGSLAAQGGHNPIEPAIWGKPIVFGPDMRDFRQIAAWLIKGEGALQVNTVDELQAMLMLLLEDTNRAKKMGLKARQVYHRHQGAVERTLACFGLIDQA